MLTMLSVKEQDLGEQSVCVFIEAPSSLDIWIMAEKTQSSATNSIWEPSASET